MKKIFALTLSLLMILGFACGCAPEQNNEGSSQAASSDTANPASDFEYTILSSNVISIDDYIGADDTVVIPSQIENLPVTCIARFTSEVIKTVVIPNTVELISDGAFAGCVNLIEIEFSNEITEIMSRAFSGCKKLEKAILPDKLEVIGNEAFINCTSLKEVYIPKSCTDIGMSAFMGCSSLQKVTLEEGLEEINGYCIFHGCSSIEEFTIPKSMKKIEAYCFGDCSSLKSIKTYGNAPETDDHFFYSKNYKDITLYYKEGTTGWDQPPYSEYTLKVY